MVSCHPRVSPRAVATRAPRGSRVAAVAGSSRALPAPRATTRLARLRTCAATRSPGRKNQDARPPRRRAIRATPRNAPQRRRAGLCSARGLCDRKTQPTVEPTAWLTTHFSLVTARRGPAAGRIVIDHRTAFVTSNDAAASRRDRTGDSTARGGAGRITRCAPTRPRAILLRGASPRHSHRCVAHIGGCMHMLSEQDGRRGGRD